MTPDANLPKIQRPFWSRLVDLYADWRYGAIDLSVPLGKRGEQAAARFLRQKGLQIVAEGETDRAGELDLIAIDQRTLVFVEVKTLASRKPGHPADRVDHEKQTRITRAALRFAKRKHLLEHPARFDVVAIWWPDNTPKPERIEHYQAAFDAVGNGQWFC